MPERGELLKKDPYDRLTVPLGLTFISRGTSERTYTTPLPEDGELRLYLQWDPPTKNLRPYTEVTLPQFPYWHTPLDHESALAHFETHRVTGGWLDRDWLDHTGFEELAEYYLRLKSDKFFDIQVRELLTSRQISHAGAKIIEKYLAKLNPAFAFDNQIDVSGKLFASMARGTRKQVFAFLDMHKVFEIRKGQKPEVQIWPRAEDWLTPKDPNIPEDRLEAINYVLEQNKQKFHI